MAIYYVKNGGNDALDGLSDANAWESYAKVVSTISAGVTAGDSFLFNGGDTFAPAISGGRWENFSINGKDGNSGAYCNIGSYGTGKAIIEQRVTVSDDWVDDGSNIWHVNLTSAWEALSRVFIDGTESIQAANQGDIDNVTHFWWYDVTAKDLYIYSTTDPAGKTVMYVPNAGSIWINNSNYWKFENLEFRGARGFQFGTNAAGCSYHEWNSNKFYWGGHTQIYSYGDLAGDGYHHITIYGNDFDYKGNLLSMAVTEDELSAIWGPDIVKCDKSGVSWTISHNSFKDGFHAHITANGIGASGNGVNNWVIEHNTHQGTNSPYVRALNMQGSVGKCNNNAFRYNYIYDMPVRTQLGGTDNVIEYCIFSKARESEAVGVECRSDAINLYSGAGSVCVNNKVLNNVIHDCYLNGIRLSWQPDDTTTGNEVVNNIFLDCGKKLSSQSPYQPGAHIIGDVNMSNTNLFKNNCAYRSGVSDVIVYLGTQYTIAEVESAYPAVFIDNLQEDPLMTDPANGDFTLQITSPCINAGIGVGLTEDYVGNIVGALPDIGAYELVISGGGGFKMDMGMGMT